MSRFYSETEIVARVEGLTVARLRAFVAAECLAPAERAGRLAFREADLARVRLLADLAEDFDSTPTRRRWWCRWWTRSRAAAGAAAPRRGGGRGARGGAGAGAGAARGGTVGPPSRRPRRRARAWARRPRGSMSPLPGAAAGGDLLPGVVDRGDAVVGEVHRLDRQAAGDHLVGMVGAHELAPARPDRGEVGVPRDAEHLPGVAGAAREVAGLDAGEGGGGMPKISATRLRKLLLALVVAAVGQRDVEEALEDVLEHLRLGRGTCGRCARHRRRSRRRPGGRG